MKKISTLIVALQTFVSVSVCANVINFTKDIREDASPHVLKYTLQEQNQKNTTYVFEKGDYHFYPDRAHEEFCYISNHNDVFIYTAFPFKNAENITIDGQGSTFIFHGLMVPFLVDNSKNITLKNLKIDWAMPFHSEALVVDNNPQAKTFDISIAEDYPYVIRNKQLIFVKEYYEHTIEQAILYDTARCAVAYNTKRYTPLTSYRWGLKSNAVDNITYKYKIDPIAPEQARLKVEDKIEAEELAPGLVRLYHHEKKLPQVGQMFVCKGHQSQNRQAPAIRLSHTHQVHLENIHIYHAGGMGVIAENCSDLYLDSIVVKPSHGRMVSTTADATHFVGCRGEIKVTNSVFNNQLDDALNVHGTYQEVVELLGEHQIGVRMGHYQQQGFILGQVGDRLGLVRLSHSFSPYAQLHISQVEQLNSRYHIITFEEALPQDLQVGDLVENLDNYPRLLVENCTISGNRARGLLLSTPKETIIRNNYFQTDMSAILIPVESSHWFESGSVKSLLIEGNTFQDCCLGGQDRAVIRFVTDDDNKHIAFQNIVIRKNTFNAFDNYIMSVTKVSDLVFEQNVINDSKSYPKLHPHNPAFSVKASQGVVFKKNKYNGSATCILDVDKHTNNDKGLKFK